jgi:hypothetical protein
MKLYVSIFLASSVIIDKCNYFMCMNAALPVTVCWNGTEDPLIPVLATNVSVEFVHSVKSLCFEF